jgi:hypothetical protein
LWVYELVEALRSVWPAPSSPHCQVPQLQTPGVLTRP